MIEPEDHLFEPIQDVRPLVEHARKVEHRRQVGLLLTVAFVLLGLIMLTLLAIRLLDLGRENHDLLVRKNTELSKQVAGARDVLTQLYAALNASQAQVIALGGQPIHFEFSVPTTTPPTPTTQPKSGGPATTTSPPPSNFPAASGSAAAGDVTVSLDNTLILGVVFTPLLIPLLDPNATVELVPDTTTEAPPLTVEVTIPPITLPFPLPTDPTLPPPFGAGGYGTTIPDTTVVSDTSVPS